jgi:hypothetical protein
MQPTATPTQIHLSPQASPPPISPTKSLTPTPASATTASTLLQRNHDTHHIFFNADGFHNHIAHHLLALYALGATPTELQGAFEGNASYQRPRGGVDGDVVGEIRRSSGGNRFLGRAERYAEFVEGFRGLLEEAEGKGQKGWKGVVREVLLKRGDEGAEGMFYRLFGGFYHPLIHFGYGVEFEQPAVVVEALAQAAVHGDWMSGFARRLDLLEEGKDGSKPTPLVELLGEARASRALRESVREEDANKIRDGILKRAPEEMFEVVRKWWVLRTGEDDGAGGRKATQRDVERATAEMINAAAYFAGAAQRPDLGKAVKFDFFYMHCVNASVFFSAFARADWLTLEEKVRLLEMKARLDVVLYVSRGCPELMIGDVRAYQRAGGRELEGVEEVVKRANAYGDDGHAAKLIRALANGETVCREWEAEGGEEEMMVRGDDWTKLINMAMDSVEVGGPRWVRNAGFDNAWAEVPSREEVAARL